MSTMIEKHLNELRSKFPGTAVSFHSVVISETDIIESEVIELFSFKAQKTLTLGEEIDAFMKNSPVSHSLRSRRNENKGEPSEYFSFGRIEFRTLKVSGLTGSIEFMHELKSKRNFRTPAYSKFTIGKKSVPQLAFDWNDGIILCALMINDFLKNPQALYKERFQ
jgi:hypothetical protein